MGALYQLPGRPGYLPGTVVEVAGPYDRYGRVLKVLQEDYKLPNPCMLSGPSRLGFPYKLSLYLIRGTGNRAEQDGQTVPALPVWGFTA